MTLIAFLNELSQPSGSIPVPVGKIIMTKLLSVLRALKQLRPDLALHSADPIKHMTLGEDYSIAIWCNDGDCREEWRFLRALENRAPFGQGLMGFDYPGTEIEYRYQDALAEGLGWAHLTSGIAISFDHATEWQIAEIELSRTLLVEDDVGELKLSEISGSQCE